MLNRCSVRGGRTRRRKRSRMTSPVPSCSARGNQLATGTQLPGTSHSGETLRPRVSTALHHTALQSPVRLLAADPQGRVSFACLHRPAGADGGEALTKGSARSRACYTRVLKPPRPHRGATARTRRSVLQIVIIGFSILRHYVCYQNVETDHRYRALL